MKIALISDIHGNGYALQRLLGDAKKRNIDYYYFLGDYITDGPNVNSIINTVRTIGQVVLAGNREEYMLQYHQSQQDAWRNTLQYQSLYYTYQRLKADNLAYLSTLPIVKFVEVEGIRILLYHGIPNKTRQVFRPWHDRDVTNKMIADYGADIYVGGHTHIAYTYEQDGRLFLNPGSVGVPIRHEGIHYGILTVFNGKYLYEQVTIPYDSHDMIDQLKRNKDHYLQSVGIWSELYFQSIESNKDVVFDFLSLAYDLGGIKTAIGETKDIDNETFGKAIHLWKEKNKNKQE